MQSQILPMITFVPVTVMTMTRAMDTAVAIAMGITDVGMAMEETAMVMVTAIVVTVMEVPTMVMDVTTAMVMDMETVMEETVMVMAAMATTDTIRPLFIQDLSEYLQ